nr:hypothetical protein [Tanacetum cinerariifolium]
EEQQEREDMRMNEQIARDAEVARIHAKEEIQGMIDSLDKSNETVAKYLQEYQQFASDLSLEKKIDLISDLVKYQEHYKKEAPESKTPTEEVSEDKIKEMMQLVPVEDVYVQALQVKHPIIDWKVHSEGERNYWQIIRLGGSTACYQFFVDLLRQLDREDLNQLWALVKEYLSIRPASNDKEIKLWVELKRMYEPDPEDQLGSTACYQFFVDLLKQLDREDLNQLWALVKEYLSIIPASNDKEMELWVELKRMYEPDPEDQLWTLTQNYMHAPVEWKLYDLSGVHHVTAKDKEIFMLVEKDYPLRRGLALVMTSYRLQVENHSQMAEDLIKKIYNIANTPRKQSD